MTKPGGPYGLAAGLLRERNGAAVARRRWPRCNPGRVLRHGGDGFSGEKRTENGGTAALV